jgi:acetylornithine deacetylase/succinyl-diaminopimelate desuccinylase-like protein
LIEICHDNCIAASRASMEAIGYAHQTNEIVPVAALLKATAFYAAIPQMIVAEAKRS